MNVSCQSLLTLKYTPLSLPISCNIPSKPRLVRTFNQILKELRSGRKCRSQFFCRFSPHCKWTWHQVVRALQASPDKVKARTSSFVNVDRIWNGIQLEFWRNTQNKIWSISIYILWFAFNVYGRLWASDPVLLEENITRFFPFNVVPSCQWNSSSYMPCKGSGGNKVFVTNAITQSQE